MLTNPNFFIFSKSVSSLSDINFNFILFNLHFLILSFILFIFFILFSILMQSLIIVFNLLLSHSFSIILPFSNNIFILLGNLSHSFNISSLKYLFSNCLSTSINNSSSLSLSAVLNLVNNFCIFNLISSLLFVIFSDNIFKSSIDDFIVFDKFSNVLILPFKLFFFHH